MRAKRPARVLLLLLAIGLLPATVALAHHGPTVEDVVAAAGGLGMGCETLAAEVDCFGPDIAAGRNPFTVIKPASGPLSSLYTRVDAHTNGIHDFLVEDRAWFTTLHAIGCADTASEHDEVAKFMDTVAAQFVDVFGTYGPVVVAECSMVGTLVPGRLAPSYFEVTSTPLPSALPTPTPTASPKPTATPQPTASPTATPKPTATLQPTSSPTVTPSPSESASASASGSASGSETATASPSATPEQSVEGATFTAEPSAAPGAPDQGVGGWPGSIPGAGDVSTKPADVGGSALAAALLLVAMGFIGELFNNTTETNYYRIITWWKKSWVGRIGRGFAGLFGGGWT